MAKLKTAAEIAEKWARVAATRGPDYEAGVKDPSVNWQDATAGANEAYKQGIDDAVGRNAFSKGVQAAGNERWRANTIAKGVARWAGGVRIAEHAMEEGFSKVRDVIERTLSTLPPRAARGDPRNFQRAEIMAKALSESRRRG